MIYRNSFHPNSSRRCGAHSLHLRSCRVLGKASRRLLTSFCIGIRSTQIWPSYESIIHILTPNRCSFFPWVRFSPRSSEYSVFHNSFIVLHPYYKLDYIEMSWGGAEEQTKERMGGNPHAKNWQDEARKVVKRTVSVTSLPSLNCSLILLNN